MKKVFIKPINELLQFDSNIKVCNIENVSLFRKISLNIEENIIYSIDDIPYDINKSAMVMFNVFEIDINDNKYIKYLYKILEEKIKKSTEEIINEIELKIIRLIDNIEKINDVPIECNLKIDVQKLFSSMGVAYKVPETYINKLLTVFKIYNIVNKNSLIITFGLLRMLEKDEISLLNSELCKLDLFLIDFNSINKEIVSDILVDDDWCVL